MLHPEARSLRATTVPPIADVNAFRMIHEQAEPWARELSLGTASVADTLGIMLAAGVSIPLEKVIARVQQ